ncbi:MAG: glycosyltransferase [Candidatus Eisenbacteria bacterium]|nr:glycosyltransferase [Candidatus Eisenbacteria bacterium]
MADPQGRRLQRWRRVTGYLLRSMSEFHQRIVPPGDVVLQARCGTGDLLDALRPQEALGLEPDPFFAGVCRRRHPGIQVLEEEVSRATPQPRFRYVIACHLLEQEDDCLETVRALGGWLVPRGRVIFTFLNPLWTPVVRLCEILGLRPRDRRYNYLTARDVTNLCILAGYDVVEEGYKVFCPLPIPLLTPVLDMILARIPVIRNGGLIGFVVARRPADPHREPPGVSVIIPCHDEEENIEECIGRVPAMSSRMEIVVVDDGSSDRTAELVRRLSGERDSLRLVSYRPRGGKAHAVREGFRAATEDIVMILDADMAVPPEELAAFYDAIAADRAEFINGTRMIYPQEVGAFTLWRLVGNKVFGILFSLLIGQRCTDTLCGTKAFYREDLGRIELSGKGWGDFDLLFGVAGRKLKMLELPVHYHERKAGRSKMRFFRDGLKLTVLCARTAIRLP